MIGTRADLLARSAWAHMDADSSGNPCVWRNHYVCWCGDDGLDTCWADSWSCLCDDECPSCGRSISPVHSEWIGPSGLMARAFWEALPEAGA